jgi:hypothetical protein
MYEEVKYILILTIGIVIGVWVATHVYPQLDCGCGAIVQGMHNCIQGYQTNGTANAWCSSRF